MNVVLFSRPFSRLQRSPVHRATRHARIHPGSCHVTPARRACGRSLRWPIAFLVGVATGTDGTGGTGGGEARELTKRKEREDREELKGEVTKDESLKSKSDTSSKNRVLVSLEISDDELDGDETYCLLLRKLSSYKLTWVLVTALTVLVCSWVVGKKDKI